MIEKEAIKIRSAYSNGFEYPFGNGDTSKCDMDEVNRHAELLDIALKKQIPQKPVFEERTSGMFVDYADGHGEYKANKYADWFCPCCGWFVGEQYIPRRHNQQKSNYCSRCGQAIDWEAVK